MELGRSKVADAGSTEDLGGIFAGELEANI